MHPTYGLRLERECAVCADGTQDERWTLHDNVPRLYAVVLLIGVREFVLWRRR